MSTTTFTPAVAAALASGTGAASSTGKTGNSLASQNAFLQLLVAQLKNQNPLSPADGTQFVSQLAQFSELDQVIQTGTDISSIRQDLEKSQAAQSGSGAGDTAKLP